MLFIAGFVSVSWLIFLRYYLIARDRRRLRMLEIREEGPKHKEQPAVPWLTLFKSTAFW